MHRNNIQSWAHSLCSSKATDQFLHSQQIHTVNINPFQCKPQMFHKSFLSKISDLIKTTAYVEKGSRLFTENCGGNVI